MEISRYIAFVGMLCLLAAAGYIAWYSLGKLGWLKALPGPGSGERRPPEPVTTVLFLFVLSRIVLYTLGTAAEGYDGTLRGFLDLWSGPDTEHYVRISQYGYQPGTEYENLIVFYPLFPLLLRLFSLVIPWPELAGMALSNLCMGAACVLLYRLCRACEMTEGEGVLAATLLILFPFSFFTQSCYTEALLLCLAIGCALFLRRRRWFLAGLFGLLAALTRTQGVLCFAMAVYEAALVLTKKEEQKPLKLLWLLLIPLGYLIYLGVNRALYGGFFAYVAFERAAPWYQGVDWVWNNLAYNVTMAEQYPGLARFIYIPQLVLFFAVLGVLTLGVRMGLEPGLLIYGGLSVLVCYTASWLISGSRYMLAVFPMYMVMARYIRQHRLFGAVLMTASFALLIFYMLSFLHGEAVM